MPSHRTLFHRHLDVFLVYNHFCHMFHLKATASLLLLLFVLSLQFLVLILGLILHHFLILVDLLTLNHLLLLLIIALCYLLYFFHHLTLLWYFLLFAYHSKNLFLLFSLLALISTFYIEINTNNSNTAGNPIDYLPYKINNALSYYSNSSFLFV